METTEIRPGVFLKHHEANVCQNQKCPLHNPSDHALREFPLDYNYEWGVMERILDSGEHVIDPDDYLLNNGGILRNSFRCRTCGVELVSRYRHDYNGCECGNFIDGGKDYLRWGGNLSDIEDTSIVIIDGKVIRRG